MQPVLPEMTTLTPFSPAAHEVAFGFCWADQVSGRQVHQAWQKLRLHLFWRKGAGAEGEGARAVRRHSLQSFIWKYVCTVLSNGLVTQLTELATFR